MSKLMKVGLVLAFLLGLSDIAFLGALFGDGDKPPVALVVVSVIFGVITIVAVPLYWRRRTSRLLWALVALRALSGLGNIAGVAGSTAVIIVSMVFMIISAICVYLLSTGLRPALSPATSPTTSPAGGAEAASPRL